MTDRSKFEQMLEHLINEEQDKAKDLFHQLVVEKSRQIYESILSEDFYEAEDEDEIGGDETDDFVGDIESDEDEDFGGESDEDQDFGDESEEGLEDRVEDLEDALDDLRAEFESLMSQEEGEEEHSDMDFGSDEDEDEDFGGSDFDLEDDEDEQHESYMREYVEKVSSPKHGDDGVNNKSIVAKPNKMGGSSANILNAGEDNKGMKKPSVKEEDFNNINVPGGNAGKTAFKTKAPAPKHGDDGVNKTSVVAKARKPGR